MGSSSDEIAREIAGTREDIEERIVTLRQRSREVVRRSRRALLIGAGVGAGAAVLVVGGVVIWRMTRPTSMRERVERVIPPTIWERARHVVESVELGLRRSVPPVRLYVGDRQVGEEAATTRWEKIGLRFAQAAGSAVGAALIARLMGRIKSGGPR